MLVVKLILNLKIPGPERKAIEGNLALKGLKQVMDAFDRHCNPKKNETVERYKFFSRFQNPGEC